MAVNDIETTFDTIVNWAKLTTKTYIEYTLTNSNYPFPVHRPKLLGYVEARYDITGNGRGIMGPRGVVENDGVAGNVKELMDGTKIFMEAGIKRMQKLNPPLALSAEKQKFLDLARIRTFNQNAALASLLNIPVCFLSFEDMARYNNDGRIQRMDPSHAAKNVKRVMEFREIYSHFSENMIALMRLDGKKIRKVPIKITSEMKIPQNVLDVRKTFITAKKKGKKDKTALIRTVRTIAKKPRTKGKNKTSKNTIIRTYARK